MGSFEIVDVFADVAGGGNPLAVVVPDAPMADARMQQVAAEFGFSETTFVAFGSNGDGAGELDKDQLPLFAGAAD